MIQNVKWDKKDSNNSIQKTWETSGFYNERRYNLKSKIYSQIY